MANASYHPESTPSGKLPPWEVAKAFAFSEVLQTVCQELKSSSSELLGMRVDAYIASKLQVKDGGCPSARAVRDVLQKCVHKDWYPGKPKENKGGRPSIITDHQKSEVARVAMDLKRQLVAPTPRNVRARLPRKTRNAQTGEPLSDWTMHQIFTSKCYDESEDDPWIHLPCHSQDVLPSDLKPLRVNAAQWILKHFTTRSWYDQVAIDPCYSLLPKSLGKQEELKVAAMGKSRWMSPESARKGVNLRAPATARTQSSAYATQVHWTPVFARGKVKIFVLDPAKASEDPTYPTKLNDSDPCQHQLRVCALSCSYSCCCCCCWPSDGHQGVCTKRP